MNILVIGNGGREHTIIWKLAQSKLVKKIYCAPGNAGISKLAELVNIEVSNIDELLSFAKSHKIDLTVVGPEIPLSLGISDLFQANGLKIFGPNKKSSVLESSKIFAKEFMIRNNIPTADYFIFDDPIKALEFLKNTNYPKVIKADGLASGKGVVIASNFDESKQAIEEMMITKIFGDSGNTVIIENFLTGEEASILAFTDGITIIPMVSSQDHKRIFDQDKGPNTGGMGAYSPAPIVTKKMQEKIQEKVFIPFLKGLQKEGIKYQGVIYAGLMIKNEEIKVLEFNVRFGDPETQAILPRLKSDLLEVIMAIVENRLSEINLQWDENHALCVVIASGGYPGKFEKNKSIDGLDNTFENDVTVFHAGTAFMNNKVVTSGGRVLGVTGRGKTLKEAQGKAYKAIEKIKFENMFFRKDIGYKALL